LPQETDATCIIVAAFAPLAGKRLLDIGCGAGVLARSLSDRGAARCRSGSQRGSTGARA
jgi:2-polyprenyl-3-methyl-5-hydroxy-6-metoxy-1,4-benzoquinol methylase